MRGRIRQLCQLLGIEVPIVQAPIGSATCPALVAAVSNAGGLGMLAATWRSVDELRRQIREIRSLTPRPYGVNLVLEWPPDERLAVCLEEEVPIISFFWGDPTPWVHRVHRAGGRVLHTVGDPQEGIAAARAGVDAIIGQGWEAGGHVRGQIGTLALIPSLVDAVPAVPVIAAGGIADGRGVAAALLLGAAGVCLGTRFLATVESAAAALYKDRIVTAASDDTIHTTLFAGGWPNAPHRVLQNSTTRLASAHDGSGTDGRIGAGDVLACQADGGAVRRYEDVIPLAGMTGDLEALAMYAGQSAGLVHDVPAAADVVRRLIEQTGTAIAECGHLLPDFRSAKVCHERDPPD